MGPLPGRRLAVHWTATVVAAALLLGGAVSRTEPPADPPDPRPVCAGPVVALTFDDGPSRDLAPVLADLLAHHDVRATFFMTGRSVASHPGHAQRFARDGHRIYNHTYDHVDLTGVDDTEIRRQVSATRMVLRAAGIRDGRLLRPPYGRVNARVTQVLRAMGYRSVRWTVDPNDWQRSRTADEIHRTVVEGLAPRANILLHDMAGADATITALPRIIRTIRRRGYCFGVVDRRGRVVRADRG